MLELSGSIISLDGDFFVRSKSSTASNTGPSEILAADALALIAAVHRLIWSIHHGVSFKWLQSFLAMIWFFFDKVRWNRGALLVACLKSGPIDINRTCRVLPFQASCLSLYVAHRRKLRS
jgi:hypothetical protein